ncbi:hypothetical protein DABAL43B_0234 [Psychrobacter sp. DAB_AL43B]|nr:hypothetical protein DABAL43B_0234 [Psychrobacter sp. DAB_AL43B]
MEEVLLNKISTIVILLYFITACSYEVEQPFTLDYLYQADPTADAREALARGDLRVYGVYGYSMTTPGIRRECVDEENIIPIEGTSDTRQSYEEAQFNTLAHLYAEYYNSHVEFYMLYQGDTCIDKSREG